MENEKRFLQQKVEEFEQALADILFDLGALLSKDFQDDSDKYDRMGSILSDLHEMINAFEQVYTAASNLVEKKK